MTSVSDLIDNIKSNLKSFNSPLASFTNYSNIYILLRAIAFVIKDQYDKLDYYFFNSYLSSATGDNLDSRAADFNLTRLLGTYSTGTVYAISSIVVTLIDKTIISTIDQQQFQIQGTTSFDGTNGQFLNVISLAASDTANLAAGTILSSGLYPSITFTVGSSFNLNGTLVGSLTGGNPLESDTAFKTRITSQLSNLSKANFDSIISTLSSLNITKYYIQEHYPITGYFTIYISANNQSLIDTVESAVMLVKPLGTSFQIKNIASTVINLSFVVTLTSLDQASNVSSSIKSKCSTYLDSLNLGDLLYPSNLTTLCSTIVGIQDIRITDPITTVSTPPNTFFKLGNVNITFNGA